MQKIGTRIEEIKQAKGIIEKDIKCVMSGSLEKLNSVHGTKLAVLNHEISDL